MDTKTTQPAPQSDSHLSFLTPEELEQVQGLEAELRGDAQILEGIAAEGEEGAEAPAASDMQPAKGEATTSDKTAAAEPGKDAATDDEDGDGSPEQRAAPKEGAQASDKGEKPAQTDDAAAADTPAETTAAVDAAAAAAAAQTQAIDVSTLRETSIAVAVVPAVEDFEGKVKDLRQQMRELSKQYAAGQIDEDALEQKQFDLQQDLTALSTQQAMHRQTAAAHQQATETAWSNDFATFSNLVKKAGGPDYLGNDILFSALRSAIEREARAAHAKGEALGRFDLMSRAHAAVEGAMGRASAGATAPRGEQPAVQRPNPRGPKTIAHLPSASQPAATMGGGNEFSYIDSLDGLDAEVAFAKLTPDQQQRYLQGSRVH